MNSERLLHSALFKIILVVCIGHALLIVWMMTPIGNYRTESFAILDVQLVGHNTTTIRKTFSLPIHPKQFLAKQQEVSTIEGDQGTLANQQSEHSSFHGSSALISLPSASDPTLKNPKPPYPISSQENGEQGRVWLSLCISEHGSIKRLQLAQSSGYPALDRSAINTVTHWKFHPARQNGAAIPYCYRLPIVFVLA